MDGCLDREAEEDQFAVATIESLTSFDEQESHTEEAEPGHHDYHDYPGSKEDEELARALQASMNDRGNPNNL